MNMSSKHHRLLYANPQLYGAGFVGNVELLAVCAVVSRCSVRSRQLASESASLRVGRAAICRAGLRSSSRRSVRGVMSRCSHRSVAVRSVLEAVASRFAFLRSTSLPNKALVLTAQTLSRSGPRSVAAPAAQLGRWAGMNKATALCILVGPAIASCSATGRHSAVDREQVIPVCSFPRTGGSIVGAEVRVRGRLRLHAHGFFLSDERCPDVQVYLERASTAASLCTSELVEEFGCPPAAGAPIVTAHGVLKSANGIHGVMVYEQLADFDKASDPED